MNGAMMARVHPAFNNSKPIEAAMKQSYAPEPLPEGHTKLFVANVRKQTGEEIREAFEPIKLEEVQFKKTKGIIFVVLPVADAITI
jgi:hypothetical protein